MSKILTLANAISLTSRYKTRVFTNGFFDLLHVGHVRYLQAARALGDCLIVGLNSDASARALKGDRHPIVPQAERAEVLAALACVDYAIIFDEVTAEHIVEVLKPEIYVKGGDYTKEIRGNKGNKVPPEAKVVEAYGGRIEFIPFVEGKSTTNIIAEILKRYANGADG